MAKSIGAYTVQAMVRLDVEVLRKIDALAEKNGTSRSAELQKIIVNHVKKNDDKAPL